MAETGGICCSRRDSSTKKVSKFRMRFSRILEKGKYKLMVIICSTGGMKAIHLSVLKSEQLAKVCEKCSDQSVIIEKWRT